MAMKVMTKVVLLLLVQFLVSPHIDAGSWQSCREVSVAKCGVGDSRSYGREYRYDIGAYQYKWTRYPNAVSVYYGPFQTLALGQMFQSCQVCSNAATPTQGGPTQNPSPPARTNIMIVDNDVGKLDIEKAELLSQIPCGSDCRLWFVGCNLTDIEGGAFAELPQVSTLVIWRSNVQTLRNGTFAGMDGLNRLLLLENNLTHLEDGCFGGLPSLSELILVDNQILTLSPDTFRGVLPWWFDVSANHISNVAPGTLQAIKSVEHVHAVENKLTAIDAGMFYGLERLRFLILEGNRISHIAAGAFSTNTKLSNLDLARNRLTFLSGGWFETVFPSRLVLRGNGIAAIAHALEGRMLRSRFVKLDNPPRCTCANEWLYEREGNSIRVRTEFKQRFISAIGVLSASSCPGSTLKPNSPAPVNHRSLPCPSPLVQILNVERSAAHKYDAVGDVYWEQSPTVSFAFPNGLHHEVDMTYDTNTTIHDSLPTGNLTVKVVTDLKAEGWVKCDEPNDQLGGSGNHSLCTNYMGKSSFTLWLETAEPLAFENTTCTASSETGSHTVFFMANERAHSVITTPQATELSLMNTTPFSTIISTTPLSTSASDAGYVDPARYILWAFIGLLTPLAVMGVGVCTMCIWRRLRGKVPGNDAAPSRNGTPIAGCSRWPLGDGGHLDQSVISPYAEGRLEDHGSLGEADSTISPYAEGRFTDHASLNDSESVISPYAEGGFGDHPDLRRADSSQSETVPYGEAKLCAAYAGRARAQTHPVPSRPYSTERPRLTPKREGAVLAAYGPNGRVKSGKKCYQHPATLTNPGATQSSAYQQRDRYENAPAGNSNMSDEICYQNPNRGANQSSAYQPENANAAQRSRKAPCYNSPALATDQARTLSSTYDQNDPRVAAQGSSKAPSYNSPALATDQARTLSSTYDQNDPREAAQGSLKAPCYNSPALATDQARTLSSTYDQNDPREAAQGSLKAPCYNSPALATDQARTLSSTYDQHDLNEAVCNSAECPVVESYEPAASPSSETGTHDEN
uniref:LRRCT domain-containing protein n=1 Tax=Branchiostoma floridae TaxID=7739 RepID=C3Y8A6_BRAFL|eukprot:XP_002607333.1 hypothetical protein BRAFLDRAFT_69743 [Branchiostoma floridae]